MSETILAVMQETPATIIEIGMQGIAGAQGKSAYDLAVEHGYTGSESDWLLFIGGSGGGTVFYTGEGTPTLQARTDDLYLDTVAKELYKWA